MVAPDDDAPEPRPPTLADLLALCRNLMVDRVTIEGVTIPFANLDLLWKTKQALREKDAVDRTFLAALLARRPG